MNPANIPPITAADFADDMAKVFQPFPWNSDLSVLLEIAVVIGVGVLIGWLLIQTVRVPLRYYGSYIDGSAFNQPHAWFDLIVTSSVLISSLWLAYGGFNAAHADEGSRALIVAFVEFLLVWCWMWTSNRSLPVGPLMSISGSVLGLKRIADRPQKTEPTPAPDTIHDDAAASLDADWADIEEQIRKENGHA